MRWTAQIFRCFLLFAEFVFGKSNTVYNGHHCQFLFFIDDITIFWHFYLSKQKSTVSQKKLIFAHNLKIRGQVVLCGHELNLPCKTGCKGLKTQVCIWNWSLDLVSWWQKNRGEELRKTSFGWPGNESSGWAKNRAVINRPKSLHLILRHKKIHSDLSYTLKAWLIIFIKFWNCSYLW